MSSANNNTKIHCPPPEIYTSKQLHAQKEVTPVKLQMSIETYGPSSTTGEVNLSMDHFLCIVMFVGVHLEQGQALFNQTFKFFILNFVQPHHQKKFTPSSLGI